MGILYKIYSRSTMEEDYLLSKRDPESQSHIKMIRRDIHLHDNQALNATCQVADQLIPLFIIEPNLINTAAH